MKLTERIERARLLCAEKTDHLGTWALERLHGPDNYAAFSRRFHTWEALEKRIAVMLGRDDSRRGGEPIKDHAEVFLRLQFTTEHPLFLTTPESLTQDKRELADWLANEATPEQLRVFALYRGGGIDFQPEDKLKGRLLVAFALLVDKHERLPTHSELRKILFQGKLTDTKRKALHDALKAIGLDGLPESYNGPYVWTEEETGRDPFLELTS